MQARTLKNGQNSAIRPLRDIIPLDLFTDFAQSISERLQAAIDAKGEATKCYIKLIEMGLKLLLAIATLHKADTQVWGWTSSADV